MPPRPDVALAAAYVVRYNRLRLTTGALVGRLWDRYGGVDDIAAAEFATRAADVAGAAQRQAAVGVAGMVSAIVAVTEGATYRPDVPDLGALRGVDQVELYRRGVITARAGVAAGKPVGEALTLGRRRSMIAAETDVALAQRAAMSAATDGDRVVGYRRVLTGKSCAYCATASTQRYHSGQLAPLHSHCDCGVAPILGSSDPGHVVNKQLLGDLKAAGRSTGDADYWTSRHFTVDEDGTVRLPAVAVHEHGELGPVLTAADHDFTGPGDLAA